VATNGGLLTKEQILSAQDLAHEDVSVPEWGGVVRVQEMSGQDRERFEGALYHIKTRLTGGTISEQELEITEHKVKVLLCSLAMVDDKGNRLFKDSEVEKLGRKSYKALVRVYNVARRLSGIGAEAEQELAGESSAAESAASA